MKNISLIITIIFLSLESLYGCKCDFRSIVDELKLSDEILVGEVISKENNEYNIRIIKEWSHRPSIKEQGEIKIIQQKTSCTKRSFEENRIYIFYIQNKSIHNCSRTIEFSKTNDIEWLDQEMSLKNVFYDSDQEYEDLDYKRKHFIIDATGNHYDTKNKNVIYIFDNKLISKNEIPEDRNWFYPIRYYEIENKEFENIDFIFYLDNSHQNRIGEPKLSKRLIRKISKSSR